MRGLAICLAAALIAGATAAGALAADHRARATGDPTAFEGDGMWIWYVSKAKEGDPGRIAAQARRRGMETVFVKAGDGADTWRQFTPGLVARLHAKGINVCAWHYVYGSDPVGEARVSAEAASRGADCLVIDAESEYEGRYAQASTYVTELRRLVGPDYPIGLAAFPYVHYHPAFPYSVFLGPGAATFNLPQMYWRAIGDSVGKVFSITYTYNGVYGRPILPLGQLYSNPPRRQVLRFRRLAADYGAAGVSWWSWQHASRRGWRAASRRVGSGGVRRVAPYPELGEGAAGDLVVWAQEHLASGGYYGKAVTGRYRSSTTGAVAAFQTAAGLPRTGVLDSPTWTALLAALDPQPVSWRRRPTAPAHARGVPTAPGHARGLVHARTAAREPMRVPASARLPAREDELEPGRAR
ncbi:MAG: hypothetical protein GEU88_14175 [Solirubrobacterales bacterium]|nr:hypothetical protein [Solirubrobacterales bacterium]